MPESFVEEQFGEYLLVEHLGRGGMADVFKAKLRGLAGFSRDVVVKRILPFYTEDQRFVELFVNEAKIAARLSHPNIIHIYELGQVDGVLYIAMEYVRGQDLVSLVRGAHETGKPMPPLVAAHLVREVLLALAHAHAHVDDQGQPSPIIHRDVSPQNIMVRRDGQVKLVDFGIAKAVSALQEGTRTIFLKGKMGYMAPEQLRAGICTPQTDIFSLGVVFHELLSGERLFSGPTDFETMTNVVAAPIPELSLKNPEVSKELERIVLKALSRDPHERYATALQMARDLDLLLSESQISLEHVTAYLEWLPQGRSTSSSPSARKSLQIQLGKSTDRSIAKPVDRAKEQAAEDLLMVRLLKERRRKTVTWFAMGLAAALLLLWLGGRIFAQRPQTPLILAHAEPPPLQPLPKGPTPRAPPEQASVAELQVDSEPKGAIVWQGPKRLGQTPLQVRLVSPKLSLTLTSPGFQDLEYTVSQEDLPEVYLRLTKEAKGPQRSLPFKAPFSMKAKAQPTPLAERFKAQPVDGTNAPFRAVD